MEIKSEKLSDHQVIGLALLFIIFVGGMIRIYFIQENNANAIIDECSIITIAYPKKFVSRSKIYYYFYLNGKKSTSIYTIPYPTMGKFERGSHLMNERFWVRVSCKNINVNRIYWEVKVPDTLQYIPVNGWDRIPYDLDKK